MLGETYPTTHELTKLPAVLTNPEPDAAYFDVLIDCTPYSVQFGYGASDDGSALLDRGEALGEAEALLEEVDRGLMKEEGP